MDPVENAIVNSVIYNHISINNAISENNQQIDQEIIDAIGESNA